jgi:2'-5' RNA ligase
MGILLSHWLAQDYATATPLDHTTSCQALPVPKRRLGVALLVPPPTDAAVDALRAALGDPALGRIPAHLTLVPPVNVREDRMDDAVAVLREAAAGADPLALELGPVASFLPVNPVVYLSIGGDLDGLIALRDAVFRTPLERPLTWSFVPHVTLADDAPPERVEAAVTALAPFRARVVVDHVHVLEEGPGRVWSPIADARLGPVPMPGRGGLPVELDVSAAPPPAATGLLGTPVTVTARRDGRVVGVLVAYGDEISRLEVEAGHEDVEAHLRRALARS